MYIVHSYYQNRHGGYFIYMLQLIKNFHSRLRIRAGRPS